MPLIVFKDGGDDTRVNIKDEGLCLAKSDDTSSPFLCTLEQGHKGAHVAKGDNDEKHLVWSD